MSDAEQTPLDYLADYLGKPVLSICHDQEADEDINFDCLVKVTSLLPSISAHSSIAVLIDSPGLVLQRRF